MLVNSSEGVNHRYTVEENGLPAIDGLVAVLTIKFATKPAAAQSRSADLYHAITHCKVLIVRLSVPPRQDRIC